MRERDVPQEGNATLAGNRFAARRARLTQLAF